MPKSRRRKRPHRSSASGPSKRRKKSSKLKFIVIAVIAGIFVAGAIFVLAPSPGSVTGQEITTPSGLKYVDEVIGTGPSPKKGSLISVHYTGTLTDGTKFDSSVDKGEPYRFRLGTGSVIKGWDEGLMSMKVGGKRRLVIPPELAYGPQAKPGIPPNSTLVFELELMDVK